jgi:hypothetical protein
MNLDTLSNAELLNTYKAVAMKADTYQAHLMPQDILDSLEKLENEMEARGLTKYKPVRKEA